MVRLIQPAGGKWCRPAIGVDELCSLRASSAEPCIRLCIQTHSTQYQLQGLSPILILRRSDVLTLPAYTTSDTRTRRTICPRTAPPLVPADTRYLFSSTPLSPQYYHPLLLHNNSPRPITRPPFISPNPQNLPPCHQKPSVRSPSRPFAASSPRTPPPTPTATT